MKTSFNAKLLSTALLSLWLINGCASNSSNKQAKESADAGDNAKAIKLADKARFQAEAAVEQYNMETTHQRGLR